MFDLLLPGDASAIAQVCERVEGALGDQGWPVADVIRVSLALGEALANAVEHGPQDPKPSIRVSVALEGSHLTLSVRDGGGGPSLRQIRHAALPSDPLAQGGRGLYILRQLADEVNVGAEGGLTLGFRPRP